MADAVKVVVGALVTLVVLGAFLGAVISHHVGGFMRTVEREAEEDRRRREAEDGNSDAQE